MNEYSKIMLSILGAFAAMTITEFLWAFYIHNLRDNKEHHAGLYCGAIVLFAGFTTILFMENHWLLLPAAIGAWFGTWLSKFFYKR